MARAPFRRNHQYSCICHPITCTPTQPRLSRGHSSTCHIALRFYKQWLHVTSKRFSLSHSTESPLPVLPSVGCRLRSRSRRGGSTVGRVPNGNLHVHGTRAGQTQGSGLCACVCICSSGHRDRANRVTNGMSAVLASLRASIFARVFVRVCILCFPVIFIMVALSVFCLCCPLLRLRQTLLKS